MYYFFFSCFLFLLWLFSVFFDSLSITIYIYIYTHIYKTLSIYLPYYGLPWWLSGKESACNAGAKYSIPGSGRSPREGYGNPLQYSCLENPIDRGAWQATVCSVAKSWDTSEVTEHKRTLLYLFNIFFIPNSF